MANADEIRWTQRLENFSKAVKQLEAACEKTEYSDLERAGLVQIFNFSFELAWKTLKDVLFFEGFEASSPRETINLAFESDYLTEDETELFLDALLKRNILSHTYNEKTAREAERIITREYAPALQQLLKRLEVKRDS